MQERYTVTNLACWEKCAYTVIRPFARCSFTVKHYNIMRLKAEQQRNAHVRIERKENSPCNANRVLVHSKTYYYKQKNLHVHKKKLSSQMKLMRLLYPTVYKSQNGCKML